MYVLSNIMKVTKKGYMNWCKENMPSFSWKIHSCKTDFESNRSSRKITTFNQFSPPREPNNPSVMFFEQWA